MKLEFRGSQLERRNIGYLSSDRISNSTKPMAAIRTEESEPVMNDVYKQPITEPCAWTPADLATEKSWNFNLSACEVDDLTVALAKVKAAGTPLARIDAAAFPLPNSAKTLAGLRGQLTTGRGFALLHGFPVEGFSRDDVELMYWGFCAHLGMGLTQNGDATLIHNVTEGRLRPSQGTRSVGDPGRVTMHVDLSDVVSLLCVRQPEDSPKSRLTSSMTIHNRLLETRPDALERLYRGFVWDRQNEHGPGESPTTDYPVPVFSQTRGIVSCRYNRTWMRKAAERSGLGFSPEDAEILDLFDEIAHAEMFEFDFNPGDVQFANNYTMLHGRAPHAPAQSEDTTRLLMRIWFNQDGIREWQDESIVRYGVMRHGRLGWTAGQLADGIEGKLHPRRPVDRAPLAVSA